MTPLWTDCRLRFIFRRFFRLWLLRSVSEITFWHLKEINNAAARITSIKHLQRSQTEPRSGFPDWSGQRRRERFHWCCPVLSSGLVSINLSLLKSRPAFSPSRPNRVLVCLCRRSFNYGKSERKVCSAPKARRGRSLVFEQQSGAKRPVVSSEAV